MQGVRQAQVHEQAKIDIFERQNVTGASERTTDVMAKEAQGHAEALKRRQDVEASGFSIQANAKRAKESKVCILSLLFCFGDMFVLGMHPPVIMLWNICIGQRNPNPESKSLLIQLQHCSRFGSLRIHLNQISEQKNHLRMSCAQYRGRSCD